MTPGAIRSLAASIQVVTPSVRCVRRVGHTEETAVVCAELLVIAGVARATRQVGTVGRVPCQFPERRKYAERVPHRRKAEGRGEVLYRPVVVVICVQGPVLGDALVVVEGTQQPADACACQGGDVHLLGELLHVIVPVKGCQARRDRVAAPLREVGAIEKGLIDYVISPGARPRPSRRGSRASRDSTPRSPRNSRCSS